VTEPAESHLDPYERVDLETPPQTLEQAIEQIDEYYYLLQGGGSYQPKTLDEAVKRIALLVALLNGPVMDAQPLMEAIRAIAEAYRSLEETKKGGFTIGKRRLHRAIQEAVFLIADLKSDADPDIAEMFAESRDEMKH
jgi:hypothetical protein